MPAKNTSKKAQSKPKKSRSSKPRAISPATASSARGQRTSITLFRSDLDALGPLRAFLAAQTGLPVLRDSTLVQVACRVFHVGPAAVTTLREILAADGRRGRGKAGQPARKLL